MVAFFNVRKAEGVKVRLAELQYCSNYYCDELIHTTLLCVFCLIIYQQNIKKAHYYYIINITFE